MFKIADKISGIRYIFLYYFIYKLAFNNMRLTLKKKYRSVCFDL